ncbi:MAG: hypothetical protein Q4D19_03675 [Lautropia sp.]|nr:hypothetical protein [Lautropia sp.]
MKKLLGAYYPVFASRFENVAQPVALKVGGGVLINGWNHSGSGAGAGASVERRSAAFVYYPNGSVSAAYFDEKENLIRYFGDKRLPVDRGIEVWMGRFFPVFRRMSGDDVLRFSSDLQRWEIMPGKDRDGQFSALAKAIWRSAHAEYWEMTPAAQDILVKVADEIFACARRLSYFPAHVMPSRLEFRAVLSQHVQAVTRNVLDIAGMPEFRSCVHQVGLHWRSQMEVAASEAH